MFTIEKLEDGIISVIVDENEFTMEHWAEYQRIMLDLLDKADEKLYILGDFRKATKFDPKLLYEAGTAEHLTHENLGLLVLLGSNAMANFALKMTEVRATRDQRAGKMRLHMDYGRAIDTLKHFQAIQTGESPSV